MPICDETTPQHLWSTKCDGVQYHIKYTESWAIKILKYQAYLEESSVFSWSSVSSLIIVCFLVQVVNIFNEVDHGSGITISLKDWSSFFISSARLSSTEVIYPLIWEQIFLSRMSWFESVNIQLLYWNYYLSLLLMCCTCPCDSCTLYCICPVWCSSVRRFQGPLRF